MKLFLLNLNNRNLCKAILSCRYKEVKPSICSKFRKRTKSCNLKPITLRNKQKVPPVLMFQVAEDSFPALSESAMNTTPVKALRGILLLFLNRLRQVDI